MSYYEFKYFTKLRKKNLIYKNIIYFNYVTFNVFAVIKIMCNNNK